MYKENSSKCALNLKLARSVQFPCKSLHLGYNLYTCTQLAIELCHCSHNPFSMQGIYIGASEHWHNITSDFVINSHTNTISEP